MFQPISEHVTLYNLSINDPNPYCPAEFVPPYNRAFFRVFPNGTYDSQPFVVPEGQLLVITDVEWVAGLPSVNSPALAPGTGVNMVLYLYTPGGQPPFGLVFNSSTIITPTRTFSVGSNDELTTGFVVGPNRRICPQLIPVPDQKMLLNRVTLRGYLIPQASVVGQ
jgi:hypothetical protein